MADTVESPIPFRPNNFRWVPSWIGTAKKWYECEDGFAAKARIAEDSKKWIVWNTEVLWPEFGDGFIASDE
ncbi:hypothetical protein PHLCEN_2v5988 [Hermanssonia centrifuga]|uniref:Uncharacterized protein n=1 Tax=Hermanssonia centrifuga TaxID=98765 RepID=A0A2R6P0Q6_9APHY|nr:hypothetical protein PHLCEN_2v5988 [Hermanssonia centrifuga]